MKNPSFRASLAASVLAFAACGHVEPADQIADAIEEENGGLDMEDEAPMFDDDAAYDEAAVEATDELADPFDDAETTDMLDVPDAVAANVAIVRQLPADLGAEGEARDWSGSIRINRGSLVVRRTVGFEDATDRVRPRTDRTRVEFDSHTRPFADGLALLVVDPDPTNPEPLTLTYERDAGGTHALELRELLEGAVVRAIDEQGDRIVLTALRRHRDPCDHGFGRGRWHALRDHLGRMIGVIADEDGTPIGHIRGVWGKRRNGEQVFFGKYIDRDGRFRGLFGGHYRDGEMLGRWMTRTGELGRLQGQYEESAPGPRVGGHFAIRWAETSCAEDLPTDAAE